MAASGQVFKMSRRRRAGVTRGLALAGSPVFAFMALLTESTADVSPFCSAPAGILPVRDMTAMYLLMALFHLPPWLRFIGSRQEVELAIEGDQR